MMNIKISYDTERDTIIKIIGCSNGATCRCISSEISVSRQTAQKYLGKLVAEGIVEMFYRKTIYKVLGTARVSMVRHWRLT